MLNQEVEISEIIVVDDGSTDKTSFIAKSLGCRVLSNNENSGRGFSRKLGVESTKTEFLVFCDSTNELPKNFVKKALSYLNKDNVAAVFGNIRNSTHLKDPVSRWRARHLFREDLIPTSSVCVEAQNLITYGTVMRKSAILNSGNFDPTLIKCEDIELGQKLIEHGYKILSDPSLYILSNKIENMTSLAIRYNRWFSSHNETSLNIWSSFRSTLRACYGIYIFKDLKIKDYPTLIISMIFPFWFFAIGLITPYKFK